MSMWKLSPSDLTFLWDECKRCFYLKVRQQFNRPSMPFPKIFTRIDLLMKEVYQGRSTKTFSPELPEGQIIMSGRWVTSEPIRRSISSGEAYIMGIFDTVVRFENNSYGVIDFKTTEVKDSHVAFYGRQLNAYAYALVHPAPGKLGLKPVSRLGLLCFNPSGMNDCEDGILNMHGPVTWVDVPYDEEGFLSFMDEVLALLEAPVPPPASPDCPFCSYRDTARNTGF